MDEGQGLVEGQEFPELLFTPTTKAEEGHDVIWSRVQGDFVAAGL